MTTSPGRLSGLKQSLSKWKRHAIVREVCNRYRHLRAFRPQDRVIALEPAGPSRGNVLLSFFTEPFMLLELGQVIPNSHSRDWESYLMARAFLDLNYSVDVIHWQNNWFQPQKPYSFFIDVRWNLQRLAPVLGPDCCKIMHIDCCHILFQNAAEASRLLAVQQRKGVTLKPRRFEWPNLAIENADCATIIGNEFTMGTFRYARKPLYPVPVIPSGVYPWPEAKDFDSCRKRFLWFGSGGLVRKGLDLVLDVFANMPDYHLTVCGPLEGDKDFVRAYRKELFETPNIETAGWTDIDSPKFKNICNNSVAMIYPSCAEGQCGGVVTAMHAGVIPVVSYETGVDTRDFGITLPSCTMESLESAVRRVASLPASQLEQMARGARDYAQANHTREKFGQEFRKILDRILSHGASKSNPLAVQNRAAA